MVGRHLQGLNPVLSFASDNARAVQKIIAAKSDNDTVLYNDIMDRDNADAPGCDVYSFTSPCQSYSPAGAQDGVQTAGGQLIFQPLLYVAAQKPTVVIGENSPLLFSKFKDVAKLITTTLEGHGYVVQTKLLSTAHFGIPQGRKRWYLAAIRKASLRQHLVGVDWWPTPYEYTLKLEDIICPLPPGKWQVAPDPAVHNGLWHRNVMAAYKKACNKGVNPFDTPLIIDFQATEKFSYGKSGVSPTLTKCRCTTEGYWCSTKGGPLDFNEMSALQGFCPSDIPLVPGVSRKQLQGCLGNAMSLNVVTALMPHLLYISMQITKAEFDACKEG